MSGMTVLQVHAVTPSPRSCQKRIVTTHKSDADRSIQLLGITCIAHNVEG